MDSDIDPDIGRWILEFLLRQPLENRLLNSLIDVIPLPNDNSGLKRTLLLRRIEFEISKGFVSENILDFLEQIEELDFRNGAEEEHSGAMKVAYCAVAVACTVKFLGDGGYDSNFKYFKAVKRIWRGKVCKMEKMEEKMGLVSEDLLSWKDEIDAAVWEENVEGNVLKRSEGIDVVGAVRDYVNEEKEKMGHSFLEFVTQSVKTDDTLRRVLCGGEKSKIDQAREEMENLPTATDQELSHPSGSAADQELDHSNGNSEQSQVRDDTPVAESSRAVQANGEDLSARCKEVTNNPPKPSLLERNSTARTFVFPSPKRRLVSPLKIYEADKLMKRRKIKKWSTQEEDTLRSAVQKFGIGNWKLILYAHRGVFEGRTEVDLKDKWRNMRRYTRL